MSKKNKPIIITLPFSNKIIRPAKEPKRTSESSEFINAQFKKCLQAIFTKDKQIKTLIELDEKTDEHIAENDKHCSTIGKAVCRLQFYEAAKKEKITTYNIKLIERKVKLHAHKTELHSMIEDVTDEQHDILLDAYIKFSDFSEVIDPRYAQIIRLIEDLDGETQKSIQSFIRKARIVLFEPAKVPPALMNKKPKIK